MKEEEKIDELIEGIDNEIKNYSRIVPDDGMHIEYMLKAIQIMELYNQYLSCMYDVEDGDDDSKLKVELEKIFLEIKQLTN